MGIFGKLFGRSDEPELVRRIRAGAEAGDVVAQRGLGAFYMKGEHVAQDHGQAATWYALAAAQGDARAQFVLGQMYVQGLGVEEDLDQAEALLTGASEQGLASARTALASLLDRRGRHAEANAWWERAAEAGDANAAYNIGCSYGEGVGVAQDRGRALHWFQRAAALGHPDAQFNVARHLATGDGIAKDDVRAYAWLTVSLGHRADGDTERLRDAVARRLSAEDLARANAIAAELSRPAASR